MVVGRFVLFYCVRRRRFVVFKFSDDRTRALPRPTPCTPRWLSHVAHVVFGVPRFPCSAKCGPRLPTPYKEIPQVSSKLSRDVFPRRESSAVMQCILPALRREESTVTQRWLLYTIGAASYPCRLACGYHQPDDGIMVSTLVLKGVPVVAIRAWAMEAVVCNCPT
jgi:hypothetical protein